MKTNGSSTVDGVAVTANGLDLALRGALGAFVTPAAEVAPALCRLARPTYERDVPLHETYGRRFELDAAVGFLVTHRLVYVAGPPGIGKTEFLARTAFDPRLVHAFPGGIVHLGSARGWSATDLATFLVDALYAQDATYAKQSEADVRRLLAAERVLVFIDDVDPALRLRDLRAVAPQARFVLGLAPDAAADGAGALVRLGPLDDAAAFALLLEQLGGIGTEEMHAAVSLIAALDGNPGRIRQLAALRRTTRKSLHELAEALTGEERLDEVRAYEIGFVLDERARALLHAVAAFGPAASHADAPLADRLETLGLLVPVRSGHALATGIAATLERGLLYASELDRTEAFRPCGRFGGEVRDRGALAGMLAVVRRNVAMDRHVKAIALGRETADGLARLGAWDAWETALDAVKAAARESRDAESEAWALNATGVRALALGEADLAAGAFVQALDLRRGLRNEPAVRITEHNLRLALKPARALLAQSARRRFA